MGVSAASKSINLTLPSTLEGNKAKRIPYLIFRETQLPKGYDFKKLSEVFMRDSNSRLVASCGLEAPENDYGKYDY